MANLAERIEFNKRLDRIYRKNRSTAEKKILREVHNKRIPDDVIAHNILSFLDSDDPIQGKLVSGRPHDNHTRNVYVEYKKGKGISKKSKNIRRKK